MRNGQVVVLLVCLQSGAFAATEKKVVWRPTDVAALNDALSSWNSDRLDAERTYGPIGTWNVSQIKDSTDK